LRVENKLDLKTIIDLQRYADSRRRELPAAGKVTIRLFDAIPLGRPMCLMVQEMRVSSCRTLAAVRSGRCPFTNAPTTGRWPEGISVGWRNCGNLMMWFSVDVFLEQYPEFLI